MSRPRESLLPQECQMCYEGLLQDFLESKSPEGSGEKLELTALSLYTGSWSKTDVLQPAEAQCLHEGWCRDAYESINLVPSVLSKQLCLFDPAILGTDQNFLPTRCISLAGQVRSFNKPGQKRHIKPPFMGLRTMKGRQERWHKADSCGTRLVS